MLHGSPLLDGTSRETPSRSAQQHCHQVGSWRKKVCCGSIKLVHIHEKMTISSFQKNIFSQVSGQIYHGQGTCYFHALIISQIRVSAMKPGRRDPPLAGCKVSGAAIHGVVWGGDPGPLLAPTRSHLSASTVPKRSKKFAEPTVRCFDAPKQRFLGYQLVQVKMSQLWVVLMLFGLNPKCLDWSHPQASRTQAAELDLVRSHNFLSRNGAHEATSG